VARGWGVVGEGRGGTGAPVLQVITASYRITAGR
jgi:hypothetical protein